jgi:hypothetical protein
VEDRLSLRVLAALAALAGCKPSPRGTPSAPPAHVDAAIGCDAGAVTDAAPVQQGLRPFSIEYRKITRFPTCRGNQRVKIDTGGMLFSMTNDKDCPKGVLWNGPYAAPVGPLLAARVDALAALVADGGFFDLPAEVGQVGHDGYREEIEVSVGGRTHAVIRQSGSPDAFMRVRDALLGLAR